MRASLVRQLAVSLLHPGEAARSPPHLRPLAISKNTSTSKKPDHKVGRILGVGIEVLKIRPCKLR